ncbi:conserved hypothetical protein [Talaromyces stipitatus ATCC 10500]|uniref:RNase H type-1 domain-containing protein n=1 Tax=Talaromyces stipitatus (strain ATCC 10500 / CBS 375.48 / QM 6759 / NRRL 1006) TaxID=441959 RepID=B8MHD0_TALSN|nr:uncharacterized protein TSTA_021660 [Talaromyces stipitatus ATCC 10500]EED17109.1 conserved hypothetical protein [Talaromyces stipitatus ATCC 10500]
MTIGLHQWRECSPFAEPKEVTLERRFVPQEIYGANIDEKIVQVPVHKWVFLACENASRCWSHNLPAHTDCLVIAVNGACQRNAAGKVETPLGCMLARIAHTTSGINIDVEDAGRAGGHVAELHAALYGLQQAAATAWEREMSEERDSGRPSMIAIKSDSPYLILAWEKNGYRTTKGTPVVHTELCEKLEAAYWSLCGAHESRRVYIYF